MLRGEQGTAGRRGPGLHRVRILTYLHSATSKAAFCQVVQAVLTKNQVSMLLDTKELHFRHHSMSEDLICLILLEGCFTSWDAEEHLVVCAEQPLRDSL